jgi:hypothetical protein
MKLKQWLEKWGMTGLKLTVPFLETEWKPQDPDRDAAWELYIELLTRIATQPLPDERGDEKTALESIHKLFDVTRDVLKRHGKYCTVFAKIAIPVLNQVVRPFTARWHRLGLQNAFSDAAHCQEFRKELKAVQEKLRRYTQALADLANVEDLTTLEAIE